MVRGGNDCLRIQVFWFSSSLSNYFQMHCLYLAVIWFCAYAQPPSFTTNSPRHNDFMRYSLYEVLIDIGSCLQSLPEDAGYGRGREHSVQIRITKFSKTKFLRVLFLGIICLFCLWIGERVKCFMYLPLKFEERQTVAILQYLLAKEALSTGTDWKRWEISEV